MSPEAWQDATGIFTASGLVPAAQVEWPNVQFDKPEPPGLWVSLRDVGDSYKPIEIGPAAIWQETGVVYFTVMAPAGTGTDAARQLAANIARLFRNLGPRNVVYTGASIGSGELADEDGAWWAMTVSVNWRYQDIPD